MSNAVKLTVTTRVHFRRGLKGRVELREGEVPLAQPSEPPGRVPKLSRLMALAIRFQRMLERGEVRDFAELARLGHVTRARVTQIMNLLLLAPDIQERILFLPLAVGGHDPVKEWQVRPIAAEAVWRKQRGMLAASLALSVSFVAAPVVRTRPGRGDPAWPAPALR
jgi:hypothetical protein